MLLFEAAMNFKVAVAQAIHDRVDILSAYPELNDIDVGMLEKTVEGLVDDLICSVSDVLAVAAPFYLPSKNVIGLYETFIANGISLPKKTLLGLSLDLIDMLSMDAKVVYRLAEETDDPRLLQIRNVWYMKKTFSM